MTRKIYLIKFLLILLLLLLLSACQPVTERTVDKGEDIDNKSMYQIKIPKTIIEEEMKVETVIDWMDSDLILYLARPIGNEPQQLMVLNMKSGQQEIFYQPVAPIVNVSISPSKNFVLVHTSSSAKEATIHLLRNDGTEQFAAAIPSEELDFSWNPYENGVLFVTSFFEDWSFTNYKIDTKQKKITHLDFPQPFAQWEAKDRLMYLDWDKNDLDATAPLISMDMKSRKKKAVMLDVLQFHKWREGFMAIQVTTEKPDKAVYKFFDGSNKQIFSFMVPRTTSYAHSEVPNFTFNEAQDSFYTFVPDKHPKEGKIGEQYKLIQVNYRTGDIITILKSAENAPITCSPEGNWCLYGHQHEKLINTYEKKVFSLVETRKDE
ncbi:hypothetical protein [Bacillus sp. V5-8f]|uniref:YqgU-like beta propeller domain-containing protein n=1 Tax=Bacillus sp. V5-8f TaxID=2053044 RepID=UPI000C76ABB1|nr:hypothetical protein [Bacillus sp. V5-8f]PLT34715.1 hypothetical protein CUU64_04715 [Bacillus sp. V5-8f]